MFLTLVLACDLFPSVSDFYDTGTPPACSERSTVWLDADGDGYGDAANVYIGCSPPEGWVDNGEDCDDADAAVTTCDTGA